MATLQRNQTEIYYQVYGAGSPVLLSHGYSASSRMWRKQVDAFPGYQVIVWDMRGHGQTVAPDDPAAYSEAETAADMVALLDHLEIENAVIGGLSLGGYMTLAFHLAHPARCRALMLFDTGPGFRRAEPRETWNRMARQMAQRIESEGFEGLRDSPEVKIAGHRSPQGLVLAGRGMLTQSDSRIIDSLPTIAVPTLVVVGDRDEPFLVPSDYMANKIPGAQKAVIADAGHASNIDQPAAFNNTVRAFLDGLA